MDAPPNLNTRIFKISLLRELGRVNNSGSLTIFALIRKGKL
jgi:hypothetical protein